MFNIFAKQYLLKLRACSPHYPRRGEHQAGKLLISFFKSRQGK